jgi:DNA polymerase III epsilon subunit-like protein
MRENYAGARITQLAWQLVDIDGGSVLAEGSDYVQPSGDDWLMHPMAEATHGVSCARLQAEGRELLDVAMDFVAAALRADVLVCHNLDFDLNVVAAELIHHAQIDGAAEYLLEQPRYCTMLASINLCQLPFPSGRSWGGPQKFKWPKLLELHRFLFGVDFDGAHDALEDVRAPVRCFVALRKDLVGLGPSI